MIIIININTKSDERNNSKQCKTLLPHIEEVSWFWEIRGGDRHKTMFQTGFSAAMLTGGAMQLCITLDMTRCNTEADVEQWSEILEESRSLWGNQLVTHRLSALSHLRQSGFPLDSERRGVFMCLDWN